jgi:hypothetical protein
MGLWLSKVIKNVSVRQPLSVEPLSFPLSSRAKPRDLQFRGPFMETQNSILKQNCHLDRSGETCGFFFRPHTGFMAASPMSLPDKSSDRMSKPALLSSSRIHAIPKRNFL